MIRTQSLNTKNNKMSKAKAEAPSLEVAIRTGGIPDIILALDAKAKQFEFIKDSKYRTSGNLEGFGGDIKTEKLIPNLIRAYSFVLAKATAYENAAKDLGLTEYPVFEVGGGCIEDWKADILLRKAIIEQKENSDKLQAFREKAAKFMSEADQKAMFIEEMKNFFNNTQV